jgi:hypothetical protein
MQVTHLLKTEDGSQGRPSSSDLARNVSGRNWRVVSILVGMCIAASAACSQGEAATPGRPPTGIAPESPASSPTTLSHGIASIEELMDALVSGGAEQCRAPREASNNYGGSYLVCPRGGKSERIDVFFYDAQSGYDAAFEAGAYGCQTNHEEGEHPIITDGHTWVVATETKRSANMLALSLSPVDVEVGMLC